MIEEKNTEEILNADSVPLDDATQPADETKAEGKTEGKTEGLDKKAKKREEKTARAETSRLETELRETAKQLQQQKNEFTALNDKYMRMIAEYDNYRKRMSKERENAYNDACADIVTQVLPILDNLERAAAYTDAEKVSQGVAMLCKSFTDTLAKLGITEIEAKGCPFDPNLHNAVMHIEDEAYGENEVIEVLQKGYAKGEKIIRYAMVKVAN